MGVKNVCDVMLYLKRVYPGRFDTATDYFISKASQTASSDEFGDVKYDYDYSVVMTIDSDKYLVILQHVEDEECVLCLKQIPYSEYIKAVTSCTNPLRFVTYKYKRGELQLVESEVYTSENKFIVYKFTIIDTAYVEVYRLDDVLEPQNWDVLLEQI